LERVAEPLLAFARVAEMDALEDLLLQLRPEAGKLEQAVLLAGILELGDRMDPELLDEDLRLLRPEPRHLRELQEPRRNGGRELVAKPGLPREQELGQDVA